MKIYCNQRKLATSINTVFKASSNKTAMPILECILITAYGNNIILTANNLELGIESTMEADIVQEGLVALEAKLFGEIIRKMPDEELEITLLKNDTVTIASGKSKFTIVSKPGHDFPKLPSVQMQKGYTVSQPALREMINQTIFSTAQEDSRPIFMGEMFHIEQNTFNLVSVDGFRISYRQMPINNEFGEIKSVVPGKTLSEITKILSSEPQEMVTMYFDTNHVLFDLGTSKVVSRLLDGEFLSYNQMFSSDYDTQIIVDCKEFLMCIERASVISREGQKNPIKIALNTDQMVISSNTNLGTSVEELVINLHGKNLEIAFNPKYLIDVLKVIEDAEIVINFLSVMEPCIIQPKIGNAYKYLILPIRVKDKENA